MDLSLSLARARYLSAIGVALPILAGTACKEPSSAGNGATDGAASAESVPIASVGAAPESDRPTSTSASPVEAGAGVPPPVARPPSLPPGPPRCPSGEFCSAEGAKVDPKNAAPAPFEKCALDAKPSGDLPGSMSRRVSFSAANTTAERARTPNACCYTWVIPCPGGRAFRDATGTPSVARVVPREDWGAAAFTLPADDLSPSQRLALAAHWTDEAAFEHASIASFAQLTLDLLAVGAPPELLAGAQRAALDEIEHARVAFALASAYGGKAVGPAALAALPGPSRSLAEIARTTFVDACVGESIASAVLAERSRHADTPLLRDLLARMADDEERHAELAWRIVAWALKSGGPDVRRALAAAQADVIDELVALTRDPVTLRGNELRASVLREVVLPCSVALLAAAEAEASLAQLATPSGAERVTS